MRLELRRVVVAAVALLTVASLTLVAWQRFATPSVAAGQSASLGAMSTEVREAGWVDFDMGHVMDGQGGFMMPDQMMPGTPRGDEVRLSVAVTLTNTSARTVEFNLMEEFTVTGGPLGEPVTPVAQTIGDLSRLGPGAAVDGSLYFDIDGPTADDPPLYLRWSRGGSAVDITVPITEGEAPPVHQH